MTTRTLITEFLSQKRFAMIGVSRQPKDFSRSLYREFVKRNYEVVPVHPAAKEIEGQPCYGHFKDITPPVTSALVMTPRATTERLVAELGEAGATLVWLYGVSGEKDVSPAAVSYCRTHGIGLIAGYCPLMFLPGAPFFHRFHGSIWKVIGLYPR